MIGHHTCRAWFFGEIDRLRLASAFILHADVGELTEVACLFTVVVVDVANEHTESRFEGGNFGLLCVVEESIRHVVNHHATLCAFNALLSTLRDAFEGAILSLEKKHGSPII